VLTTPVRPVHLDHYHQVQLDCLLDRASLFLAPSPNPLNSTRSPRTDRPSLIPGARSPTRQNTQSPTLILHALDDGVIPHSHSKVLLHHLHAIHTTNSAVLHQPNLTETTYPSWGSICAFDRGGEHGGKVVRWEGLAGGHNNLGWAEGTMDLIKQIAKL
jgi:hypothetical protein